MENDPRHILKKYTNARIAMGRAGSSVPTHELLQFRMAHSLAKDAINSEIDIAELSEKCYKMGLTAINVESRVTDRNDYLRNPTKGKQLNSESKSKLEKIQSGVPDISIIVADGLSADAVNYHAEKVINLLLPQIKHLKLAPVVLAKFGRVALSDSIGEILKARIALIFIGERPGLSSPHSMGAYLTYLPRTGTTDERRNCVSNIHPEGLNYKFAADKLAYLIFQMHTKEISGVGLKDDFTGRELG